MNTPLRVLILEDSEDDALLLLRELRHRGYKPTWERVQTREAMKTALGQDTWDIILADYHMPRFTAIDGLKVLRETGLDIPFIVVSGTIGEDTAVEAMKTGASDYFMKNNLTRLVPAIERELREAQERRERNKLEYKVRERTAALLASEEKYRLLVENANEAILVIQGGRIKFANSKAADFSGCSIGELVSRPMVEFICEPDRPAVEAYFNKITEELADKALSFRSVNKQGKIGWAEANGAPIIWEAEPAILVFIADISERKQAEKALLERVRELGCIADVSRLAEKPRISIEEFVQGAVSLLPPAWQYPEICCARITMDSKEFKTANFRETKWSQSADIKIDRKKFGVVTVCYLEEKPASEEGPFLKEERSVINTVAELLGHILQHRRSETEIRASETKFRTIFDNANDGLLLADMEYKKFHSGNAAICRMLGYSREEIKNVGITDIHPEKDMPHVLEQFEKQARKEIAVAQSLPVKRKDGSVFYADISSAPVEISGKRFLLGIFRDITERKHSEEALRCSERKYRQLFEGSFEGIYQSTFDGRLLTANRSYICMFGYPLEIDLATIDVWKHYAIPDDRQRWLEVLARDGYVQNLEKIQKKKDGTPFVVLENARLVKNPDGSAQYIEGILTDITDLKNAERELKASFDKSRRALRSTIKAMSSLVEIRDPYTAGHQRRVAALSEAIARDMGLTQDKLSEIHMTATIHDLGKNAIPTGLLAKPAKLTALEFEMIKTHAQVGYEILKDLDFPWPIDQVVYQHHERLDGSGYPRGLKGDEILLEARILAVADVVEAMLSHRPYRPALGLDAALAEIEKNAGRLYDPDIVASCLRLFKEENFQL